MISYLCIIQVVPKIVFQNNATDLPYLIWLRASLVALQVELLDNAIPPEYMVTSPHPLRKAQNSQQAAKIVEADTRIRATAEHPLQ